MSERTNPPPSIEALRDELCVKLIGETALISSNDETIDDYLRMNAIKGFEVGWSAALQELSRRAEGERSVYARFWSKVDVKRQNECWVWKSSCRPNGYGEMSVNNKSVSAHVLGYEYFKGKIPPGLWVDHICRNRKCVNPLHLRAVTPAINGLENTESMAPKLKARTHCNSGHEFNEENTHWRTYKKTKDKLYRSCRVCRRLDKQRRDAKKRASK